jgi:imidazole glycerol-phosphate synthase subunit HisH
MSNTSVCILDYGSGNVGSVYNIFKTISESVVISNNPQDMKDATHLVLPGVGAFGASMKKIHSRIPIADAEELVIQHKKPFLGICVGMQVLVDTGLEFGEHKGLGWIPGVCRKIETDGQALPHVGWNDLEIIQASPLTTNFQPHPDFYFVHSYVVVPENKDHIVASTTYGEQFCSIIQNNNIFGVQFHPEKSQKFGKQLLINFLNTH